MRRLVIAAAVAGIMASVVAAQVTSVTFNGDSAGDTFGRSVSGAGDVNGDGFADLIVGSFLDDNTGSNSGSARVFSGLDGTILYTFNGDSPLDSFGVSVSGAGDVNGDGFADLIVGAHGDDNNGSGSGSARVLSGFNGSILYAFNGDSADDYFGISVSGAGDVNGDGFADLIVGAYRDDNNGSDSGSARVFSGFDGSMLYTFNGDGAGDRFGVSVSGAGDVNGDGFADLIVGANRDDNNGSYSGSARVFSGFNGSILYTFNGDGAIDYFGYSVSGAGDVNGDGFAELIVGAFLDDNNGSDSGSARVFSGVDGSILYTFNGDGAGDRFGGSVSGAGDVNGDGLADLIVGAYEDDNNGLDSGSARVFSGFDGSILYTFNGDGTIDYFGFSVSGAGDVNGDGLADLIVGAHADDNNGTDSGSARVFIAPPPGTLGGGQANSSSARLWVNNVSTGSVAGPFISVLVRGQYSSFEFSGAPNVLYELYGSSTINPGGWLFPGFGSFDLGTGPTFSDCYFLLPGFQGSSPIYSLDATGHSSIPFYVNPALTPGASIGVQALIQNAQPWTNGVWGTITAAHVLVVQ